MSYEYRVTTDKKVGIHELKLIYENLIKYPFFDDAILVDFGISVPSGDKKWSELVEIELIDEGFFITANMRRTERDTLFEIIQGTMSNRGINVIIKEE